MNIVVCVKQVPDTTQVRVNAETNTLIREGIPSIVNPYDVHAVEAAVAVKETTGGRVTALTMGPPQAREALKEMISLGADDAVLISDRAFAGSDTLATGYILSEAIRKLHGESPIDLIICGKQSIDGDTAQVGPGIAQRLGFTQLTYVIKITEIDVADGRIVVERQLERGHQVVEGRLPALLTVVKEMNEVRYAPLPNLIKAAKYEPRLFDLESLGLDRAQIGLKGSPTTVRKIFAPPPRAGGAIIADRSHAPEEAARLLVEKFQNEKLL